jgi:putative inorganic carbon (hco3(-)) transporter
MLILTVIILLLGLGISIVKPKWAILSVLLFYTLRPFLSEFVPEVKFFGDIVIIGCFVRVFFDYRIKIKELFSFHLFEYAFFAFLAIGSISAYLSGVSPVAIVFQVRAFSIGYLLYFIVKRLSFTKKDLISFFHFLFWWTVAICIHGLVEKLTQRQLLLPENWRIADLSPTNRIRIYGIFGNPNVLSLYVMFVFFLTYFYREYLIKIPKKFIWTGLGLFGATFLLTYSRGTTIGILVFILFYLFKNRSRSFLKHIILIFASSFIFSFIVVQTTNWIDFPIKAATSHHNGKKEDGVSRFKNAFSSENMSLSSEDGRLFYIKKGLVIFKDHPIIGTGFGTYGDSSTQSYLSPIYKKYGIENTLFYTDNQYIQIIVETGIIGVLAFAIFLLSLLHYTWKSRKRTVYFPILSFFLLGFCVHGFYYNIWESYIFVLFFYFVFALHDKKVQFQH